MSDAQVSPAVKELSGHYCNPKAGIFFGLANEDARKERAVGLDCRFPHPAGSLFRMSPMENNAGIPVFKEVCVKVLRAA
jgi:hypothetical protein